MTSTEGTPTVPAEQTQLPRYLVHENPAVCALMTAAFLHTDTDTEAVLRFARAACRHLDDVKLAEDVADLIYLADRAWDLDNEPADALAKYGYTVPRGVAEADFVASLLGEAQADLMLGAQLTVSADEALARRAAMRLVTS